MLHDAGGPAQARFEADGVVFARGEKLGVVRLELADFIGVSWRDAATRRTAGFVT